MKLFIDRLVPSKMLQPHLSLVMTRAISRDEAIRWAVGAQCWFRDSATLERCQKDLGYTLKPGAPTPQQNAWEAVFVEEEDGRLSYWLFQVR
jgi:hypothetical protein